MVSEQDVHGPIPADVDPGDYFICVTHRNHFSAMSADPVSLTAWEGARNLASGDFDGDGIVDLAVAGSDKDVTQNFEAPWLPLPLPPATATATAATFAASVVLALLS